MSEIERRKAANEAVFRNVNERIQQLQHSFAVAEREPLQMICECDRSTAWSASPSASTPTS